MVETLEPSMKNHWLCTIKRPRRIAEPASILNDCFVLRMVRDDDDDDNECHNIHIIRIHMLQCVFA